MKMTCFPLTQQILPEGKTIDKWTVNGVEGKGQVIEKLFLYAVSKAQGDSITIDYTVK